MREFFEKVWVKHTIIVIAILIAWQLGVKFLHQDSIDFEFDYKAIPIPDYGLKNKP